MFNKVLLSASVAVMISGSAMAADAIVYNEPAPAMEVSTFSWAGAYAGVNAGYGFGKFSEDGESIKPRGFVGGAQVGYNWQFDQVVAGIEADFQGSTMKKTVTYYDDNGDYLGDVKGKVQWFGTVRGRVGMDIAERTMLYGTAGLAYGKVKISGNDEDLVSHSESKTRAGWTAGAGIEHAFTDNVTLKTEYLYTDLGKVKFVDEDQDVSKIGVKFHTIRVGVNYKF